MSLWISSIKNLEAIDQRQLNRKAARLQFHLLDQLSAEPRSTGSIATSLRMKSQAISLMLRNLETNGFVKCERRKLRMAHYNSTVCYWTLA